MQKNIDLKNLIKDYKYESTTDKIRELKHSGKIRNDISKMIELKKKYNRLSDSNRKKIIEGQCSFLYNNYTNIFNKIYKDNIDLNLFNQFLIILKGIEDGKYDQHEASVQVGSILKQIYLDSAIREADRKKVRGKTKNKKQRRSKNISWNEYKKMNAE